MIATTKPIVCAGKSKTACVCNAHKTDPVVISKNLKRFQQAGVSTLVSLSLIAQGPGAALAAGYGLPALPYAENALEPYVDAQTMNIHHTKHHQAYVTNLNAALDKAPALKKKTLVELNKAVGTNAIPSDVAGAIRNQGGGHWNHTFFWNVMGTGCEAPSGDLEAAINKSFGSLDSFKEQFSTAAKGVFGSGWAWLVVTPQGDLAITTTPNQDNPLMAVAAQKGTPVIGIDVWEHAYYLKHQNKRPDYISDWLNVVNWDKAAANYADAKAGKVPGESDEALGALAITAEPQGQSVAERRKSADKNDDVSVDFNSSGHVGRFNWSWGARWAY